MSDSTMMVLRETRDLALTKLNDQAPIVDNMLEALALIHSTLDNANIDDENESLGIVERVKRLLTKSEISKDKLIQTDELHNKALATIEELRLELEEKSKLATKVELVEIENEELRKELELVTMERDKLQNERNKIWSEPQKKGGYTIAAKPSVPQPVNFGKTQPEVNFRDQTPKNDWYVTFTGDNQFLGKNTIQEQLGKELSEIFSYKPYVYFIRNQIK